MSNSAATNDRVQFLQDRYTTALQEYVEAKAAETAEAALHRAYKLGRGAVTDGVALLDLALAHRRALMEVRKGVRPRGAETLASQKAWEFFLEALGPYEMTQRGFREVYETLMSEIAQRRSIQQELDVHQQHLEEMVDRRTAELKLANESLRKEMALRVRAQEELRLVNRALRTISECNRALVSAATESELLDKVCRIIVDVGGYPLVCVSFADQDPEKTVRLAAHAVPEGAAFEPMKVTWADDVWGRGPTGTAIRTGKPYLVQDFLSDPGCAHWRPQALRLGIASALGLPLLLEDGQVFGAVSINAAEPDAFQEDEMKVLVELADDLTYGIQALRMRERHAQAEEALRRRTTDLGERVKELQCLYGISRLIALSDKSVDEVIKGAVHLIPPSWYYPEVTCARIALEEREFITDNFRETPWKLSADIVAWGKKLGSVDVFLLEEKPVLDEGPFLKEERALIDDLGRQLGVMVERKRAEDALRNSERLNRTLVEHLPQRIFIKDRDSVYRSCNARYARDLGIAPEQIVGKDDFVFYPSDLAEHYRADDGAVMASGAIKDIEEQYLVAGEERWVHTVKVPYHDEQGRTVGVLGIFEDITERKRAEDAFRESEARYRTLFEGAAEGILVADAETRRFKYANPAMCRMLGYTQDELTRLGVADIHPKEDLPSVISEFDAQARGEKTLSAQLPCLRKDGIVFYADIVTAPAVLDGRQCNVGFFTDITERKQAEEELGRLNLQNELILSSAAEGILGLDLQGNHTFVNPAAARMLGYEVKELLGRPSHSTWHHTKPDGGSYPQEECEIYAAYRNGAVHRVSTEVFWRKDGTSFPVEYASTPMYEQGRLAGAVVTFADITERKLAEMDLKESGEKLHRMMEGTIRAITSALEMRDPYTAGHEHRVADLACAIAGEMGLADDQIEGIRIAGYVHDIGKISVPAEILAKPGKLTDLEFAMIKTHPLRGHEILKEVEFASPVALATLQHHERLDGSGYPQGLSGDQIILEARILAVADVVEAMSSHRPYRPALGMEAALEEIAQKRGTHYDPQVVDACVKLFKENRFRFE